MVSVIKQSKLDNGDTIDIISTNKSVYGYFSVMVVLN